MRLILLLMVLALPALAQPERRPAAVEPRCMRCPSTSPQCPSIATCGEAMFLLRECGFDQLDRDRDGLPCEWTACRISPELNADRRRVPPACPIS